MKVFGCRGESKDLIAESFDAEYGRILDRKRKLLSPLMNFQRIFKWGYWEEC